MNKISKIKIIALTFAFGINILFPNNSHTNQSFIFPIITIIVVAVFLPALLKLYEGVFKFEYISPQFNDTPFTFKRILSPLNFIAQLFLAGGTGIIIGTFFKYKTLNYFGLVSISYGLGVLIGIIYIIKSKSRTS